MYSHFRQNISQNQEIFAEITEKRVLPKIKFKVDDFSFFV